MLSTSLQPISKCIVTDYLNSQKYAYYTTGYLVHIEGVQNDTDILCSVLLTGVAGKLTHKPTLTKMRTPPIMCSELASEGVYSKCSCFLLVDNIYQSYLTVSSPDFINMLYARIVSLNRISCNYFPSNAILNTNEVIKNFFINFNESVKVHSKAMVSKVDSEEKRIELLHNIVLMESFIKKYLPRNLDTMPFIKKAHNLAKDFNKKALAKKLATIISHKDYEQILSNSQETKDALHRYKNCGYWL